MSDNVKVSKFKKVRGNIERFYKDIKSELKKVIWPNKNQLVNNTGTVLFACLLIGIIIWIADLLFGQVSSFIFTR